MKLLVLSSALISAPALANPRVIYGRDNRQEVRDYRNARVAELAKSTVVLVRPENLVADGDKFQINERSVGKKMNLCPSERFRKQPAAGYCSGFLVAENKIMTAGHCIESMYDCENVRFVFDYNMVSSSKARVKFEQSQVFQCKSILGWQLDPNGIDFAIVELDRAVTGRTPLKLSTNASLRANDDVLVIGHPSGIPTKITDGASVRRVQPELGFFTANLDTYGGNSGSPVFNAATLEVEGILVRGEEDFVENPKADCRRSYRVNSNEGRGEDVTLMSVVSENGAKPEEINFLNFLQGTFKAP